MTEADYIRVSATTRQLQEIVFNRAAEAGVKLSPDTVKMILIAAVELAAIAHFGER